MRDPEDGAARLDATPAGVVGALYSLVALMQAGERATAAGEGPMSAAAVADALGPYEVDAAGAEVASLASLAPKLLRTLAVNLGTARRELESSLAHPGGKGEERTGSLAVARARICGSLRIVRKLNQGTLGGQLGEIFALFEGQ